jgi:hypothetical protein
MRLVTIVRDRRHCRLCHPRGGSRWVATELDRARAEIAPPLGVMTYTLDSRRLLDQPGDENRSLAQSLGQLPGVTFGPNGQLRVRGQ